MHGKNIKKLFFTLSLSLMSIVSISLVSPTFSSVNSFFFSYGQDINSTESDRPFLGINNAVGLSLIPLMIKEMENTNATTIPIKQVINATPSNATALQNISKNSTENNNTNTGDTNNGFNPVNDTAKELIPFVVNLTKNTNATTIPIKQVINATPSNATALQNISKNGTENNNTNTGDTNNGFNPVNDTAKELIPFVNLTKNPNTQGLQ
jgi:hypothetical protein